MCATCLYVSSPEGQISICHGWLDSAFLLHNYSHSYTAIIEDSISCLPTVTSLQYTHWLTPHAQVLGDILLRRILFLLIFQVVPTLALDLSPPYSPWVIRTLGEHVNAVIVKSLLESLNAFSHLGQCLNVCHSFSRVEFLSKFAFCMLPYTELEEFQSLWTWTSKGLCPFCYKPWGATSKSPPCTQE